MPSCCISNRFHQIGSLCKSVCIRSPSHAYRFYKARYRQSVQDRKRSGKLNFYLSAADDLLRTSVDSPTLGLLLCESRGETIVEYALRDIAIPIGVSTYRVTRQLPEPLRGEVPSIEDLQGVIEKLRNELHEQVGKQHKSSSNPADKNDRDRRKI